jgi:hypothetical protein
MRRLLWSLSTVALVAGFIAPPKASAQQSIYFFGGEFVPKSLDGRGADDILFANGVHLNSLNQSRGIDIKEFNGPVFGGGWTVGLTDLFDAGIDVGFYQRAVPTVYTNFVNKANGNDIAQELKLRIVPVTATIRFLPLGHHGPARPYIGGGVGIFSWRYSEVGDFLDDNNNIFRGDFVVKGTSTGPVVLGGVIIPIGAASIGGEIRYQSAKGTLPTDQGFGLGATKNPTVDLGGMNYLFTLGFRF